MRALGLVLLTLGACSAQETLWLSLPGDEAVSFFVLDAQGQPPEILGRFGPESRDLRVSAREDGDHFYVLTFDRAFVLSLGPRLDQARWAELELQPTPEVCERRPLHENAERRPLPPKTATLMLDLQAGEWVPVELPPPLVAQLSVDLPLDPNACGTEPPRLDFFARVEDGLSVEGRSHYINDPDQETDTFLLRDVRRLMDGSVLAISSTYLYWLRADRRLLTAEPGEVLAPDQIRDLPPGEWAFGDLEHWPNRPGTLLVSMVNEAPIEPRGALVEVSTSSAGIRSARYLSALGARLSLLAVDGDGGFLAAGGQTTVAYGRPPYDTSEMRALPGNVSARRVIATGRADFPFAAGSSSGTLLLLNPWDGRSEVLAEGGLSERTEGLAVDPGPPWRIDQLQFTGLLFSWEAPGPGSSQTVPMPSALRDCASAGDACTPHVLPKNPDAIVRDPEGGWLISPEVCSRPFSWDPARDCLVAWELNPPLDIADGFIGFDVLVVEDNHLLAAGGGGVVYQGVLD